MQQVAIVGCGYIGRRQARVIPSLPGLEVSAVIDPVAERRDDVANTLVAGGAPLPAQASSLTAALGDRSIPIDVVVVGVPSGLHAAVALEAIHAGKHTLIEKPLEVTMAAIASIAAAAEARPDVVVSVVSQHRLDNASQVIRKAIEKEAFGALTSALAILPGWRSQEYYDSADWRGTWALDGGGALMNQGVHNLDVLVWLMGKPVEVFGRTGLRAHENIEVEDTAVATITFDSGALATLLVTTAAYPGGVARLYINGSAGSAIVENDRLVYFHSRREGDAVGAYGSHSAANQANEARGGPEEEWATLDEELEAGHRRQWEDFLDAMRTGRPPVNSIDDATRVVAVIRAIYESSTRGTPIMVADVLAGKYESILPTGIRSL